MEIGDRVYYKEMRAEGTITQIGFLPGLILVEFDVYFNSKGKSYPPFDGPKEMYVYEKALTKRG